MLNIKNLEFKMIHKYSIYRLYSTKYFILDKNNTIYDIEIT
jgi:hypothetical protein